MNNGSMEHEPVTFRKKRILHDLWIIWIVQLLAMSTGYFFLFLYSRNIVPNYPDWDTIHSLCGVISMASFVTFVITMLWEGYKIMDEKFMPKIVRVYAASLYLVVPILILLITIDPRWEKVVKVLIWAFPLYSIIPLFFVCLWLSGNIRKSTKIEL